MQDHQPTQMPTGILRLFAVAAGVSVANIYCAQPMLNSMAHSFSVPESSVGSIITVTQAGYALGLIFVVPLGDLLNRRRFIVRQLLLSAIALGIIGVAQDEGSAVRRALFRRATGCGGTGVSGVCCKPCTV